MFRCKTFREFIKVQRKNWRKQWHRHRGFWNIWIIYDILSIADAEITMRSKHCHGNLPIILEDFIKYKGQNMYFHGPREVGKLIGIEITNEDYYYIYEINGQIKYDTCVDRMTPYD